MSIEKSIEPIGNRTRDLPAVSKVPQPTTLPRAPALLKENIRVITVTEILKAFIANPTKYVLHRM
jgi:hypothetical protein